MEQMKAKKTEEENKIRRAKDMGIYSISVVILVAAFFLGFCIGSLITAHATVKEIRKRNDEGKEFAPHYVRVDIEEANDHGANDHI